MTIALAEVLTAIVLLIGLQYVITRLSNPFDWMKKLIKARPTRLFDSGKF